MKDDRPPGQQLNLFGTWVASASPIRVVSGKANKKARTSGDGRRIVRLTDLLAWPIELEPGNADFAEGGRVPFEALHFLRYHHGIDVSSKEYSWSKRGDRFYMELVKEAGRNLRQGS